MENNNNFDFNKEFAKNLNNLIDNVGISKQDFADKIGVSHQSVYSWCAGRKIPRMSRIEEICKFFNIDRSEIVKNADVADTEAFLTFMTAEEKEIAKKVYKNKEYAEILNLYVALSTEKRKVLMDILRNMQD